MYLFALVRVKFFPDFADIDPVIAYVEKNRVVYPHLDNRVTVTGFKLRDPNASSSASAPASYVSLSAMAILVSLRAFVW